MVYILMISVAVVAVVLLYILEKYDIRHKGKCIKHNWEHKFECGDYWSYTGTFLRNNERWECKKCHKIEKNEK